MHTDDLLTDLYIAADAEASAADRAMTECQRRMNRLYVEMPPGPERRDAHLVLKQVMDEYRQRRDYFYRLRHKLVFYRPRKRYDL